jgi:hypothetical protein
MTALSIPLPRPTRAAIDSSADAVLAGSIQGHTIASADAAIQEVEDTFKVLWVRKRIFEMVKAVGAASHAEVLGGRKGRNSRQASS